MSILGAIVASLFAIAIPTAYFVISIIETRQTLTVEAAFIAKSIERIIQARPDLWDYETVRLKEDISQPSVNGEMDEREIINAAGKPVAKTDYKETGPIISISAAFFDSGQFAGTLLIRHSILSQVTATALFGILSSLLGYLIFYIFRTYPIRKLEDTLTDLQRERDKSNRTLYAIGDGVITVDHQGRILFINRAAESLLGMDASEAVGRQLEEVYVLRQCRENQAGGKEGVLTGMGDEDFVIEEIRTPLNDMDSDRNEMVIVLRDITERRKASEALQQAHDELEKRVADRTRELMRANEELSTEIIERTRAVEEKDQLQAQLLQAQKMESVGRLAGGVAHDFNNMLSAILGHAELAMMRCNPSEPIRADLKIIEKSALRSADLVRQLLAFARKQTVVPKVLDMNDSVPSMLKMLLRLIGEDIELLWRPGAELWPIRIDPSQLDQILANLCVNARDAISGVGRITIATENAKVDEAYCATHPGSACGEYVKLMVNDSGCGISEDLLDHIFEPFFTTKEVGKGTGLGLATVYGIIKQNEGFIEVSSARGKGSTFNLYLPRFRGELAQTKVPQKSNLLKGYGETVLLVEDEAMILNMSRTMLERMDYRVLTAGNPGEALRQAQAHADEIQLLISDVIMPEMNGRELAKQISHIKPELKCLFVSGYTSDVIANCGVLDEGIHFLQKPFSTIDLATKVSEILRGQASLNIPAI